MKKKVDEIYYGTFIIFYWALTSLALLWKKKQLRFFRGANCNLFQ